MSYSLHLRLFGALALAALLGGLATGLVAVALDPSSLGFIMRAQSVAPKALGLGAALVALAALGAALGSRRLARPVEDLADDAARMAEGHRPGALRAGRDVEVRRIARALTSMRREADSRPFAAAFLRDAWHDLKTPLAGVRATVEVLEDGAVDDPAAARRFLANLSRSAAELERMLDDLVTLARLETAGLARERPESVGRIVARAVDRVAPLAAARGVALGAEPRARSVGAVRCDAAAVGRALGNLLENAVDATPAGGTVSVSLGRAPGGSVVLDVVNEPAAVPLDARSRLFERATTSGKGRGSGLGLAIARAAFEAHGGRVRFVELGPPRVRVRVELPGA